MNVKELELFFKKNHQLVNITAVNDSGKNFQWMLKPWGENMMKNRIFTSFQNTY